MAASSRCTPRLVLLLVAISGGGAFIAPMFRPGLSHLGRVQAGGSLALPFAPAVGPAHTIQKGSNCGGGGRGGGGWGRRNNLGEDDGRGELGGRRTNTIQALLAVRGGDAYLTADAGSRRARCPATNALLCVNVVVYLLQVLTQGWLLTAGAKMNSQIISGQYYRLLTPVFLHGGLLHLLCNSLSLNAVVEILKTQPYSSICIGICQFADF